MAVSQLDRNITKPDLFFFLRKTSSPRADRYSMSKLLDLWLSSLGPTVKKTTFSTYLSIVDTHLRPELGEIAADELSDSDIASFMAMKCSESSGLSKSTVRGIASVLRNVLEFGREYGCRVSPESCKFSLKTRKSGVSVLTDNEQERLCGLLGLCPTEANLGVLLSLKTGLRVGEICALKWGDISLSSGFLCVNRTIQRIKSPDSGVIRTTLYFGEPKSLTSRRKVPLSQSLIDILTKCRMPDDCYVVSGRADKTVEPRTMQRHFKMLLRNAGIRDLNFHVLRHTFATKCVERGFDVKSLSMILGHSDVSTTMNVYVHPSFEKMQEMMSLMD